MSNKYVLSIDPGGITGMSMLQSDPLLLMATQEVESNYEVGTNLEKAIDMFGKELDVVIERYIISGQTAKKSQQHDPLELIGQTKWICERAGHAPPFLYSPSEAKTFSTDARLKSLELWHKGGAGHANDSLRHAVLHLVKTGWKDERLLRA